MIVVIFWGIFSMLAIMNSRMCLGFGITRSNSKANRDLQVKAHDERTGDVEGEVLELSQQLSILMPTPGAQKAGSKAAHVWNV